MNSNVDQPTDVSIAATRALSKALFGGAQYRIEIGAAIADLPIVNTAELAVQLHLVRQSVNQELQVLERAGLLTRTPGTDDGGRKVFFFRQESNYWSFCTEALSNAAEMLERKRPF
jgi:predicted transcriptional regulator